MRRKKNEREKKKSEKMEIKIKEEHINISNINQNLTHNNTSPIINHPLKLPLLPEMSHPNVFSSHSPRSNNISSNSSSSSTSSSNSGGSNNSSSSSSCGGSPKNIPNQLNDPDFEEACDIRLMNSSENLKFSQSPPTSSLHASSLHLTDVNELVLSPNQQLYNNSPIKSPTNTPIRSPSSPIFETNYNEENIEKVNSNYLISSPYRNDIFSEFDMLGSLFESLDELENKSDYTESSSNDNCKYGNDFSLDKYNSDIKKGTIEKDEIIYNFKKDNFKKVFHAWCNKGKHEINYDNKKFNSVMEWINYIEELMSHELGITKDDKKNDDIRGDMELSVDIFSNQDNYSVDEQNHVNQNIESDENILINKNISTNINHQNEDDFISNSNDPFNFINEHNNNNMVENNTVLNDKNIILHNNDIVEDTTTSNSMSPLKSGFSDITSCVNNSNDTVNLFSEYNNAEDHVTYSNHHKEKQQDEDTYFNDQHIINNKIPWNHSEHNFVWNNNDIDENDEKNDHLKKKNEILQQNSDFNNISDINTNDFDINSVEDKGVINIQENSKDNITSSNYIEVTDPWKK